MVRPRLVEEGKPLGDWISSDDENDDGGSESMEMEDPDHAAPSSISPRQRHAPLITSTTATAPQSSLLQALGGKLPTSTVVPKRPMKFEIGGGNGHNVHDDAMMEHDNVQETAWNNNNHHPHSLPHHHAVATCTSPLHPPPSHALASNASTFAQFQSPSLPHPHLHSHATVTTTHRTHYEIGADERATERMQGVEDHSPFLPLVVVDGANVAYAYAQAREEHFHRTERRRLEPDVRGLSVTCAYFDALARVRVVLPASFVRAKPRATDTSSDNAHMETDRFEILQQLQQEGKLVASPPTDDDDAYCLTIAQRENTRAQKMRHGQGPAFVLSNDMFRDAQERDTLGHLKEWLNNGDRPETGPGRISYTFVDLGTKDDYGDPIFDLVPNPRHPLIAWIESQHRQHGT